MWKPVSTLCYRALNPKAQAIAVVGITDFVGVGADLGGHLEKAVQKWASRAAGLYGLGTALTAVRDVVRDLLANPQVRAIVFDTCPEVRERFSSVWRGGVPLKDIDDEHVTMVRQFVDLYDDDFGLRGPQQPFSPTRVMYLR